MPNCVCACVHAQSLGCIQLFCDPVNCSPPGSSVHGILQARILEWVAISFSRGSSSPRDQPVSPALQVDSLPLSRLRSPITFVSFCKKLAFGGWGLHLSACGILVPQPGIKPRALAVRALSLNYWTTREFPKLAFFFTSSEIIGESTFLVWMLHWCLWSPLLPIHGIASCNHWLFSKGRSSYFEGWKHFGK